MNIAYVRVSSKEQNEARQVELIREKYEIIKWFMEKKSGKNMERAELKQMMDFVREGDTIIVESYSRFARSTKDLLELMEMLREKRVGFISIKENCDTNTPQGKLMITIFAALAEFERLCILERQAEGLAIAKLEGRKFGRPKIIIENFHEVYKEYKEKKKNVLDICREYGISRGTFYRKVAEYEKMGEQVIEI